MICRQSSLIVQCCEEGAREILSRAEEQGISGVINVAWNTTLHYDPWMPVLRVPAHDGHAPEPGWWGPVFAFFDWAKKRGRVLVHCWAGTNRSRGTACILHMREYGCSPAEAQAMFGQPSQEVWAQIVGRGVSCLPTL